MNPSPHFSYLVLAAAGSFAGRPQGPDGDRVRSRRSAGPLPAGGRRAGSGCRPLVRRPGPRLRARRRDPVRRARQAERPPLARARAPPCSTPTATATSTSSSPRAAGSRADGSSRRGDPGCSATTGPGDGPTSRRLRAWLYTGWTQGVAVADYDGDGDLDLFLAQHGPDTLWQNQGDGTFRDVTARAGLIESSWGVGATWGDYDGDGWLDLYVVNYLDVDAVRLPPAPSALGGRLGLPGAGGTFRPARPALAQPRRRHLRGRHGRRGAVSARLARGWPPSSPTWTATAARTST